MPWGNYNTPTRGRSPHGERGLKSVLAGKGPSDWVSLSSWRAWIEILPLQRPAANRRVALLMESVD